MEGLMAGLISELIRHQENGGSTEEQKIVFAKTFKKKVDEMSLFDLGNYFLEAYIVRDSYRVPVLGVREEGKGRLVFTTRGEIILSLTGEMNHLEWKISQLKNELREEKEKYSKLERKILSDKKNQLRKSAISKITHKYTEQNLKYFEKDDYGRLICPSGDYSEIYYFSDYETYIFGDNCIFKETGIHVAGRSTFGDNCIFGSSNRFAAGSKFGNDCVFGGHSTFEDNTIFGSNCYFGEKCNFALFSEECFLCSHKGQCDRKTCLNRKRKGCSFGTNCSFEADCSFA